MRLTKIKLAGFKSFVDSVTFHLPSNLVGIVGPNGCGKSNIIDAVRWVMGESSARNLRGESMTDVIFNGSATRKPVGQASIELVFDNSAGKLGGPWAGYNEISIKRLVSRDSQSSYFLNNVRCRRRDITDIFLGTGLGPRSYAIIGQGMISRVIESKPEELRIFLEEAAGISKYKERRRETENRIRHTREHLDRLKDLREELARQLQHLQRQAQVAEQYQQYRAEERRLKAELLALRWKALNEELAARELLIRKQETALEARLAEQCNTDAQLEAGKALQEGLNQQLSQVQARYYQTGMEIARLEQGLQHQRELHQRQIDELRQIEQDLERLQKDIRQDEDRLRELEEAMARDEPVLETNRAVEAEMNERLELAEAAMQDWQSIWEDFRHRQAQAQREVDLNRTRIDHLERQLLLQERRMARLQQEQGDLTIKELEQDLEDLQRQAQKTEKALAQDQSIISEIDKQFADLRETAQHLTLALDEIRKTIQTKRGRLASLEALQEAALGRQEANIGAWLQERRLDKAPRLAEQIDVEPGWEQAVETVLGHHLQAVCTVDLELSAADLTTLEQGRLTLLDTALNTAGEQAIPRADGISAKVHSSWPLDGLLFGVGVAADFNEASTRRSELRNHESLITPEGIWLGRHWLRVVRDGKENDGVLVREREIKDLRVSLQRDTETLEQHAEAQERIQAELGNLGQQHASLQKAINEGHREHARLEGQVNTQRTRLEQVLVRRGAIHEEWEELNQQVEQDREVLQETRQGLEGGVLIIERLSEEHEVLLEHRESLRHHLEDTRAQAQAARQETQQKALVLESQRTALASTRQAWERLKARQSQLRGRREQLMLSSAAEDQPLGAMQTQLEALLEDRINIERQLEENRRTVEEQEVALHALEQNRAATDQQVQELRQTLEAQRLNRGEASVRRQTLSDQLQEMDIDLDTVLAHLPAKAEETQWQARLEKMGVCIQRLGAVNLAAIEEFAQLSERKHYLDSQNDDLVEALTTLENAMRKIDRDTRSRFKDTFDRVNQKLQELFPRLFGGGQAYLTLTGEDLLDAGITIMAQPPGKRIGNIHLLSGGEKALTAVALVFALFQLNPAPFCMLDEVDAPLDEANVSRFGKLVQEMSEQVQFIFITHNKGTMEIARHLSGVTMQEPGVSRLVAVDVEEAVQLAAV